MDEKIELGIPALERKVIAYEKKIEELDKNIEILTVNKDKVDSKLNELKVTKKEMIKGLTDTKGKIDKINNPKSIKKSVKKKK